MDGPPSQEEDFSSMPVADRLAHKNWKARVSAYETLVKTFQNTASDSDPAFKPYTSNPDLLKKIATDSNAVAQEKGVECLVAYVKFAGETAAKTREAVIPALVDKCFGSARAGTKNQALELTFQYVEVENGGAGVVGDILPGLGAKQPKTVAGCVVALREIIRLFGVAVTPPPPVLKVLPKIFAHSDKTVRAEGTLLTHTLYQYIGPGIDAWLADLKPVQVKELKEAFEKMEKEGKGKGTLKPERMTRAQVREAEAAAEGGGVDDEQASGDAGENIEAADLDPRAFAEPEDIVSKIPASFSSAITSSKWKERKEVLDDLLTVLGATPRIKEAPELGELAKALATRVQSDANINCVMTAANCLETLAKGMMSSFSRYRESVVPPLLERLKERKANVTDAIGAALDAVFHTVTLPDIIPDLGPALAHKNPQVKEGTLKFLGRCLATSKNPIQPAQIKPLAESLASLLEDSFEGARNEAAVCLGTMMKMVGERPLNAVIEPLAEVRKAKIKEAYEKATVKCKAGSGGPPKPVPQAKPTPPPAAPPKKKAVRPSSPPPSDDVPGGPEPSKKLAKPPARLLAAKTKTTTGNGPSSSTPAPPSASATSSKKPPPTTAATKGSKAAPPSAPGALDSFKYKHTPEDAESLATELIPASILADLGDANWKTRLAALDEMNTWLEGVVADVDAEVVVRALAKKGWSEKNFQVSAKIYGICSMLAERSSLFGRSCVALCVPHMAEKLGDMKLKKPAGDTLLVFGEKTSLQFVLNQAYEPLSKQKAPKVLADAITWVNSALTEFGIAGLTLRSLIDFLKTALQNSNASVRTSATKTLVTLKLFAGSSIKDLLEDLNPQLLNTIASEFDKVEGTSPPDPTRVSADVAAAPVASTPKGGGLGDALDDLFPRVEIDSLLKGTSILADAKSDAWKTKKEALETLQSILDQGSNKRLKPSIGELAQVLKARVVDTNKAVQTLALDIVARVATGMGKPFEKQNRFFVLPVATVLSDQKAPIRQAALTTLTAIATACEGLDSLVPGLTSGLETTNPLQKATLLHWISDWFKEHEPSPSLDLSAWVPPIVASLDDRNTDVRKGAQGMLPTLIACAGFDYVLQQTNSLKPASRSTAVPLIQAARPTITEPSVPNASKSKAPAPPSTSSVSPPPPSPSPAAESMVSKPASTKLAGIRRKIPPGSSQPESRADTPTEPPPSRLSKAPNGGLKRPGATASSVKTPAASIPTVAPTLPLSGVNSDLRRMRCGKDSSRWINEGGPTREDLAEALHNQMEAHASKELLSRLFSHDHNAVNDHINGLAVLCELFSKAQGGDDSSEAVCLANFDLPLKYASIKLHEPQPNLISKCLELVESIVAFLRAVNCQLTDNEALCFIPTIVYKLGDAREQVRVRVQQIIQSLPKVYAYSRIFQLLLDHGLKSKVAKTRQGALDELGSLLKKSGMSACEPSKAFPVIASMISDKDSSVRKSALSTLSEGYSLVGDKIWALVGPLPAKDKTQLEERLRRVTGPSGQEKPEILVPPQIGRITGGLPRPGSPALTSRIGGIPRPASPAVGPSRLARPASPAHTVRSTSPTPSIQPSSSRISKLPTTSHTPASSHLPTPASPTGLSRPKSALPSRLGRPRSHLSQPSSQLSLEPVTTHEPGSYPANGELEEDAPQLTTPGPEDITITISSILSSDPSRSVDALKKIQKILSVGADAGSSSSQYQELAEHTEGLIETITLQMAHIFERPEDIAIDENFRLAKHLIQTLNNFCDHPFLAESLTVDILTSLLEELTLRLLETDDSPVKQVKDLSRFINMIILRLFATGRRMSIFRALFGLLLQIVKPFPVNGTLSDSQEAKVAELVLKCVWKLARSIPQDLSEQKLDPVELFPAVEHFLQSVPPNEWRARATNKVPCGDMPLRTIKVIIQHVVAHYGDDVYELLSASFDDPSATIVYPYVYRILNSSARANSDLPPSRSEMDADQRSSRPISATSSRPISPHETASSVTSADHRHSSPSRRNSPVSLNGHGGYPPPVEEPDPDAQLLIIIGHISSETTGALHKEGITELHHFLKAYPHKRPRVEKMLESTGAAFRKYINRALASRAAEDQEREVAVADTLSKLESKQPEPLTSPIQPEHSPRSPRRASPPQMSDAQDKLSRLHDLFQYRSSTQSNGSSHGRASSPRTSLS